MWVMDRVANLSNGSVSSIAPPQYKTPKMSFFERIIAHKLTKKIKKLLNNPTDLDKTAKESKSFGTASLLFIL
jgi:hypothetical protein